MMNEGQLGCSELISLLHRSTTELVDEIKTLGQERVEIHKTTNRALEEELNKCHSEIKILLARLKQKSESKPESSDRK